jgi:hypothetical protein
MVPSNIRSNVSYWKASHTRSPISYGLPKFKPSRSGIAEAIKENRTKREKIRQKNIDAYIKEMKEKRNRRKTR